MLSGGRWLRPQLTTSAKEGEEGISFLKVSNLSFSRFAEFITFTSHHRYGNMPAARHCSSILDSAAIFLTSSASNLRPNRMGRSKIVYAVVASATVHEAKSCGFDCHQALTKLGTNPKLSVLPVGA